MVKGNGCCERDVFVFLFVRVCVNISKRQRCECVMIKEQGPAVSAAGLCVAVRVRRVVVYL